VGRERDWSDVTELNASTGSVDQVISGATYRFYEPDAIAANRNEVFVANLGGSVTELDAATGALVRVISAPKFDFYLSDALAVHGNTVDANQLYSVTAETVGSRAPVGGPSGPSSNRHVRVD
jgi:hypothetical protein